MNSEKFVCRFIDELLHSAILKALHWETCAARDISFCLFSDSGSLLSFDKSRFDWNELIDPALRYNATLTLKKKKKDYTRGGKSMYKSLACASETNFIAAMKPCEFEKAILPRASFRDWIAPYISALKYYGS